MRPRRGGDGGATLVAVVVFTMLVGFLSSTLLSISLNRAAQSHRMRGRQLARLSAQGAFFSLTGCLNGQAPPPSCPGWRDWQSCGNGCYRAKKSTGFLNAGRLYSAVAEWFADGTLEITIDYDG